MQRLTRSEGRPRVALFTCDLEREIRGALWLWLLLLFSVASPLNAAPASRVGPRVAVFTLQDQAGLARFEQELLLESLRGVALQSGLRVMTRENMLALLPPGTRLEDCVGSCEVETGRQLGVSYIITGTVGRLEAQGGALVALVRLHETRGGALVDQLRAAGRSPAALAAQLRREGSRLLRRLRSEVEVSASERALLYLETTPSAVTLRVDGAALPARWRRARERGLLLSLPPGRRRIQISAPGFEAREEEIELRLGQPARLRLRLARRRRAPRCEGERCLATVQVYTRPAGAALWVDGRPTGVHSQPLPSDPERGSATLRIPAGQRWLSARLPGHRAAEQLLQLRPGQLWDQLTRAPLRLTPHRARIRISSTPSRALVRLNGAEVGQTPWESGALRPGPYQLELIAPGHLPRERLILVEPGERWERSWTLARRAATLQLQVSVAGQPLAGVRCLIDGVERGVSDARGRLTIDELRPGERRLELRHPLYQALARPLRLEAGARASLRLELRAAAATLTLHLAPPGARARAPLRGQLQRRQAPAAPEEPGDREEALRETTGARSGQGRERRFVASLDGRVLGPLPLDAVPIPTGRHELMIRPEGADYARPLRRRVELSPGERLSLELIPPRWATRLQITSTPPGATLNLDGVAVGRTPWQGPTLSGPHAITVSHPEHPTWRGQLLVPRGGLRRQIDLRALSRLSLRCQPSRAAATVNGRLWGAQESSEALQPGAYSLRCALGDVSSEERIFLNPGARAERTLALDPEALQASASAPRRWRRAGLWIGGIGLAGAAAGLTLLLGPTQRAVDEREQLSQRWLRAGDPATRASLAAEWEQAELSAQRWSTVGWGMLLSGLSLSLSGGGLWWWHRGDGAGATYQRSF